MLPYRVLAALALALPAARAADFPQWGAAWSRNMVSAETGLPETIDLTNRINVAWTAELGTESYATPVVAGGRVLVGANNGSPRDPAHVGDRGVLLCFDEKTGAFCWQLVCHKLTNSIYWDWPKDGLCSPVTVEGRRVYVVSNRGQVLCLDLDEKRKTITDADAIWCFDLIRACGVRQHDSAHASILIDGDHIYVNTSNGVDDKHREIHAPDAPSLVVLDKKTGRLVARDGERIGPDIFHCTWSAPSLGKVGGKRAIFFCGGNGVLYAFAAVKSAGDEMQTLAKLWSFDCDPAAPKTDIHSYLSNRKEGPSNMYAMPVFVDGRVYVTVGGDLFWGKREAWLKCIDAEKPAEIWSYPLVRHSISTPAIHDGLVFVADVGRHLHCVDAATGKAQWTHDLDGDVWASPLLADGKIYVGTRKGDFWVFAAAREKRVLSCMRLDGGISATACAANGTVFISTMKRLYAFSRTAAQP